MFPGELCLHHEPVHVRHVKVENDAIGQTRLGRLQKLRTGTECLRLQAGGTHQAHECFADGFFVVNHRDVQTRFGHGAKLPESTRSAQLDLRLLS